MKKIIFCLLSVFVATSAMGDLLIPERREDLMQRMQQEFLKCTPDSPLLKRAGFKCVSCDSDDIADMGCEKCSNRINVNGKCYKKCSTSKPLLVSNGKCLACDEAGATAEVSSGGIIISGCEKCSDRINIWGRCFRKCTDDKPLIIWGSGVYVNNEPVGGCKTCDADGVGIYGCEKCPNRTIIDGKCYQKCPDDKPLLLSDGYCKTCDFNKVGRGAFKFSKIISGCEKCPNRMIVGEKCEMISVNKNDNMVSNNMAGILNKMSQMQKSDEASNVDTKCGDDKPILASDGQCLPCYYDKALPDAVSVVSGCERCLDRKVIIGAICNKKNEK